MRGESFYVAQLLEEWGVPRRAVVIEEASRNTRGNALETKENP
ncbi:MAG: YdcF family protein [Gammaproteobacteria bacterium]|nr:YdcF family protein [Gammaproteobacteria bacterium]